MQPPAPLYPESLSMREARARFFAENGFDADGGYGKRWFRIETRPIPIYLPNLAPRVAAVRLHDLHHIVAGYRTDWRGEAEIGAWEIGGGCGRYWAAWYLNIGAMAIGLVIHSTNLYAGVFREQLLDETVGALRGRLGLNATAPITRRDRLALMGWSAGVMAYHVAAATAGLAVLYFSVRAFRGRE